MKKIIYLSILSFFILNCNTPKTVSVKKNEHLKNLKQKDTVKITNKNIEYEIIIIEPGFNYWLVSSAQERGFYTQKFLENRNRLYVIEWNQRVLQPQKYRTDLYDLQIDYQHNTNYGYEVNYLLYNYFIYFQLTYKEKLGSFTSRL